MLSRSAVVKLKAILIIDLIIVGAVTGVYFYLQSQGVIAGATKPATFTFSDLTVDPLEAFVGQSIQITVNVTNIGDIEGNTTVNLEINGAVTDSQNLTLAGLKTSQIIAFTAIEMNPGNYSVIIGDLTGSFNMKAAPPEASKIVLSGFQASPYEVWPNQTFSLTADAVNPSSENSTLMVTATIDGTAAGTQLIELAPGASQKVQINATATP